MSLAEVPAFAVFVENPAGARTKHIYDEKRLVLRGTKQVSRPYPFPYGFIVGTTAPDGDSVDCFIITGRLVDCGVWGLMEQSEDGIIDHNVLVVPRGEAFDFNDARRRALVEFVEHVFDGEPDKRVTAGRFLDATAARAYIAEHQPGRPLQPERKDEGVRP
jgi:inorganic pyrophosphatase